MNDITASTALTLLEMQNLPRDVFVRQQFIPPKHYFPAHSHAWHQLLYATSGVLIVDVLGERLFVPPEKAVWLPSGCEHSVATAFGAELKSLYIRTGYQALPNDQSLLMEVSPLLKELILKASTFAVEYPEQGYEQQLIELILSTLPRQPHDHEHLPWPSSTELHRLCSELYDHPGQRAVTSELAQRLALSKRTLERRFRTETGMSLQAWCQRLRFLKSIELLNAGENITRIALELGYSSPSPFIYSFRAKTGLTPGQYLNRMGHGE